MAVDEKYVEDFKKWVDGERVKISLLKNEVDFLNRDIELSKRQVAIAEERIKYFEDVIADALKGHEKYIQENEQSNS